MSSEAHIETIEIDPRSVEAVLERAREAMPTEDYEILKSLWDTHCATVRLLRERGSTIARLRRLFRLRPSERAADVLPADSSSGDDADAARAEDESPAAEPSAADGVQAGETPPDGEPAPPAPVRAKGHGRIPASAYRNAEQIHVPHQTHRPGDRCCCARGSLHAFGPMVLLRIFGRAPLGAKAFSCDQLRCNTCGKVYTASAPAEARGPKFDETAVSTIANLRYGAGLPHNRLERLQSDAGTPVPASTQWDVLRDGVAPMRPVHGELQRLAANGTLLQNDDTYVRILSLTGKRRADLLLAGKLPDPERTGLFTTAILSRNGEEGPLVALFFTGRQHAGENLTDVLDQRAAGLPPPLHMCDGLDRNRPSGHEVIKGNCLAHARRYFVDELENFPSECRHVIERLGVVFGSEAECKRQKLSDAERLLFHQQHSRPVMDELERWMQALLDEHRVEPSSGLGHALRYSLKRWEPLTLFLREPGAPLDNNADERAAKKAIIHRKNSLFYRSELGAEVGDIYMSLIYTCELHGANPFHYLTVLQVHARAVAERPGDWLPWTYTATLERLEEQPEQRAA